MVAAVPLADPALASLAFSRFSRACLRSSLLCALSLTPSCVLSGPHRLLTDPHVAGPLRWLTCPGVRGGGKADGLTRSDACCLSFCDPSLRGQWREMEPSSLQKRALGGGSFAVRRLSEWVRRAVGGGSREVNWPSCSEESANPVASTSDMISSASSSRWERRRRQFVVLLV